MIDFYESQREKIMREHEEWLDINKNVLGGPEEKYTHNELRANLFKFLSLYGHAFYGLDLRYADFSRLYPRQVRISFTDCNFEGANFYGSSLYGYLRYDNMQNTNLIKASLECDFQGTDFNGAKTDSKTNFRNSILSDALNTESLKIPLACPEKGEFIAWKKCIGYKNSEYVGDVIVKLLIPEYARRSSATRIKCRCDVAKVIDIQDYSGKSVAKECVAYSLFKADPIMYIAGRFVRPTEPFEENRFKECASGIHFFMDRKDAVSYELR